MLSLRPIELFLIQLVFYISLWLWNDYTATLVSIIFGTICLFVLVISLITEWIEPSKVPRWYFGMMVASILAPIVAAAIFVGFAYGQPDWLTQ